jgi:DNA-directed RNA polymerase alpha subunit
MTTYSFSKNQHANFAESCHGRIVYAKHIPTGRYILGTNYLNTLHLNIFSVATQTKSNLPYIEHILESSESDFVFWARDIQHPNEKSYSMAPAYKAAITPNVEDFFNQIKSTYNLMIELKKMELSDRTRRCLTDERMLILGQVAIRPEDDIKQIKNFGPHSFDEIRGILEEKKLSFGMSEHKELVGAFAKIHAHSIGIDQLDVSDRTQKCLEEQNILDIGSLSRLSSEEVKGIKNLSKSSYEEIEKILSDHGLEFADPSHKEMDTAKLNFTTPWGYPEGAKKNPPDIKIPSGHPWGSSKFD